MVPPKMRRHFDTVFRNTASWTCKVCTSRHVTTGTGSFFPDWTVLWLLRYLSVLVSKLTPSGMYSQAYLLVALSTVQFYILKDDAIYRGAEDSWNDIHASPNKLYVYCNPYVKTRWWKFKPCLNSSRLVSLLTSTIRNVLTASTKLNLHTISHKERATISMLNVEYWHDECVSFFVFKLKNHLLNSCDIKTTTK